MSPSSNVLGTDVEQVLSSSLQSHGDVVYVIDPTPSIVESLVAFATEAESVPEIRVLAAKEALKEVMDDFLIASNAADLVEASTLDLRVTDARAENTLLVTDASVTAVVTVGDAVAGLVTDDEGFVQSAGDFYRRRFDDSEPFRLRTPAISRVRTSMAEELGAAVREDFDSVLDSMRTAAGDSDGLDEVMVSLLVAARNEVLLYDVSKWGEDVGVASKATFSRTKSELEDLGLIATEKVPIDVGRPRLRLKLDDERLVEASTDELADLARAEVR